jgi:ketosteroid isomerase-like protein
MNGLNDKNRAIAIRFLDAIATGDEATLNEIVDPKADFWILGHGWFDHKTYMANVAQTIVNSVKRDIKVVGSTAEGERVALEVEGCFEFSDGKIYRNTYHHLFVIRDGKIVCVKEYMDTAAVAAAFGM